MRSRICLLVVGIIVVGQGVSWASGPPVAVSPGDASKVTMIADACPTFSWSEVEGAKSYELLVYRVGEEGEQAEEVVRQSFPGAVYGWTPSLESCLARGRQYAWSVRVISRKGPSEWSAPSLFEVAPRPSEAEFEAALEVVQQYVAGAGRDASSDDQRSASSGVQSTRPASSGLKLSEPPAPLAPTAAGDSDLMVNGAAVVTTATLGVGVGSQLCAAVDYRFVDLNDGTVFDCNTAKIWLKDASCLGQGTWDDTFPRPAAGSAQDIVNQLNNGTNPTPCKDYTNGTYSDWELPAMTALCGGWDGECSGYICCNASTGLVDGSFSPAVANATGDGQWMTEDAFFEVQSNLYWSATDVDINSAAWAVNLSDGGLFQVDGGTSNYVWPVRDP